MGIDLSRSAKVREMQRGEEFTDEEWVDILKIEEIINDMEKLADLGLLNNNQAIAEFLMAHGMPSMDVVDFTCLKTTSTCANMLESGKMRLPTEDGEPFIDADGELTKRGLWRMTQLTTIAIFQYGFEFGRRHGLKEAKSTEIPQE